MKEDEIIKIRDRFIAIQLEMQQKIKTTGMIKIESSGTVAGVDLAYWKRDEKEYACCCIVVLDFQSHAVLEKKYCIGEITVPYIPGCLAFREYELVEKTVRLLENSVDLYVFDGNGYLHPRHMGLATYAGIRLEKPSIGVAKSFYKFADVDYTDLPNEEFACMDIVIDGEVYGRVLRTHKGVKPIFLSIGNMIDLETATQAVRKLTEAGSHIPIPTRYADMMTHEVRRQCLAGEI